MGKEIDVPGPFGAGLERGQFAAQLVEREHCRRQRAQPARRADGQRQPAILNAGQWRLNDGELKAQVGE